MMIKQSTRLLALGLLLSASLCGWAESLVFQGPIQAAQGRADFDFLEATPDGKFIYAINDDGTVQSHSIASDGTLSNARLPSVVTNAVNIQDFAFSPNGEYMLAANNNAGTPFGLYAFYRGDAGGFEGIVFREKGATDTDGVLDKMNVTGVVMSPDNKTIYAVGRGNGAATGTVPDVDGGEGVIVAIEGVEFIASSPRRVEYTSISFFQQDDTTNATLDVLDLEEPVDVAATNDGVYVISNGTTDAEDSFIYFSRASDTGKLTFISSENSQSNTNLTDLAGPVKLLVQGSGANTQIFIAAQTSGSIIQYEKRSETFAPSLKAIFNANSSVKVSGLVGIVDLQAFGGALYAVSPVESNGQTGATAGAGRITPFYLDGGELKPIQNDKPVAVVVSSSPANDNVNGLKAVGLLAIANGGQHLYATSRTGSPGFSRLSRQSNLSLVINSQNRRVIQPGQIAGFAVTVTNNGPTDAPGVLLSLSPSHSVTSIAGDQANTCETTVNGGTTAIRCETSILEVNDTMRIQVAMRPTSVSTARLSGSVASRNTNGGLASATRDSDEVKVGTFKNGSLAAGVYLNICLLLLFVLRFKQRSL